MLFDKRVGALRRKQALQAKVDAKNCFSTCQFHGKGPLSSNLSLTMFAGAVSGNIIAQLTAMLLKAKKTDLEQGLYQKLRHPHLCTYPTSIGAVLPY